MLPSRPKGFTDTLFFKENRHWIRTDPVTLGIIAVSMAGVGLGVEAYSMLTQPKTPTASAAPAAPSTDDASAAAQAALTKDRRALLASGGATTLTGIGGAPILSGDTASKSLLGGQMKKGQTHSFSFIKSAMGTSKGTAAHVTPAYAHDQRVADKAARKAMSVKPGKSKW